MRTVQKLDLNEEDVDGVSFSISREKSKIIGQTIWDFSIMKLSEDNERIFNKHELGYKYQIVLYKDDKAEVFEAILGDLKYYVNNMVSMNQEGLVMKKCNKSEEILQRLFKGHFMEMLADSLIAVANKKSGA